MWLIADFEARHMLHRLDDRSQERLLRAHALGFKIGGHHVYWHDTIHNLTT